jgi:MinD-like ATPase involved in chromosome partitioning or flagellar assembly
MPTIISIHSFRGGTGKSNMTANLAASMVQQGRRVAIVDTDIPSPGIHVLFGLDEGNIGPTLNDYLYGHCPIEEVAHDVTSLLGEPRGSGGALYLLPSSSQASDIAKVLREGYEINLLQDGFYAVSEALTLDYLLLDTHPGLNEETLLSIAISDALAIIMRPDQQDYQGTGVTVEVARKLGVPKLLIVLNKVPQAWASDDVRARVEKTYQADVGAVVHHSDEMMTLASSSIFAMRYPNHEITYILRQLALQLVG